MNTDLKNIRASGTREHRARVLAALGDPTRLGIMELLGVQDLSPDAMSELLDVPGNLLAHHIKVLLAAGLVQRVNSQSDRRRTYLQAINGAMDGVLPEAANISAPRVVFVCTHNSARSVLAEALWRESSDVPSASAGTHPAQQINHRARKAADRHGLDIRARTPQRIEDVVRPDDVVVSVCDSVNEELGEMNNHRIHWSIPDPAAIGTDTAFNTAVNELRGRVTHLASRTSFHQNKHSRKAQS